MKAYVVAAGLSGAQSPVRTYHLAVAKSSDEAVRMVQEELALFDDSVFLLEPLPAAEAAAANIDLSTPGYRRRWTLAMRGER